MIGGGGPSRLLITADAVGGIWTYALDLGRGLRAHGVDVTIAVLGPGLDGAKRDAAAAAGCGLVDLGHPPEWLADDADAVTRAGTALAACAAGCGAGLVQLNHPALAADVRFGTPLVAVCHSCVATWWATVQGTSLPPDFAWRTALVGRGLRAAHALVAPSHAFAAATRDAYGLAAMPTVVFNGRAAPDPTPCASPEPIAAGLTIGRLWDEGKGAAILDRAAALTSVPIRAVGPLAGPNGTTVTLRHLHTAGAVADTAVRAALAERPVFLSAAPYEPFGLAVLEAAQAGCALVLADTATFREIWEGAAIFVPVGDATGFAQALDHLIADPATRARLGLAARERAGAFTLERQVDAMRAIYAAAMPTALAQDSRTAARTATT